MFNDYDISNEIYKSMEKQLVSNQLEHKYAFNKYAKTIDFLNKAASIFDKAGMYQEANEISKIMNDFASKISLADNKKIDYKKSLADGIYDRLWDALNHVKNVYRLAEEDGVWGAKGIDSNADKAFEKVLADANHSNNVEKLKKYSSFQSEVGWALAECNTFTNTGFSIIHNIIKDKKRLEEAKYSYSKALTELEQAEKLLVQLKELK